LGLFQSIFGVKNNNNPNDAGTTHLQLISDNGWGFYSWDGKLYESDLVRSAIRPKARAVGKLVSKHIRNGNGIFQVNPDPRIRFLLEEPNPLMTGQVLQEKLVTQLELNNNAFAFIKRDDTGFPNAIYPIPCTTCEAKEGKNGDLFYKFYFKTGQIMTIPAMDVIHLRQDFHENDIFADSPARALTKLMEVVDTADQSIIQAIKSAAVVRWLLKFKSVLKPEDMTKQINNFVDNYLKVTGNKAGAAGSDPRYDAEQVKPYNYVPEADTMKNTYQRILSFFNTNEKIIQSDFNEDEWNAYYGSVIEPIATQLAGEYTRKLFTRTQRGYGNKIIFESSTLETASLKTKMMLVQMVDRGALTPNEWRAAMNLPPVEGGDEPLRRLDTVSLGSVSGGTGFTTKDTLPKDLIEPGSTDNLTDNLDPAATDPAATDPAATDPAAQTT
jgi:HK97 family phage portal protein